MADTAGPAALRAELMAAAVVAAHNHVLRRWLRGETPDPMGELDNAMRQVISLFAAGVPDGGANGAIILALRTEQPLEILLPAITDLLEPGAQ
jgi:hypothetical protein